ncbi:14-3-3-like protein isoform X2 [Cornus florida]|uniref:14-3-3-like protein isoform X2 n=1 Tax=Cornus florida TaxID=4283 RepID=UPI00289B2837|nr:14-3-3-like protein isoform X2 [Cornus florida]
MASSERKVNVDMANLAERTEHYEKMLTLMEKVPAAAGAESLTEEERNLFASWRIISSIEKKEKDDEDYFAEIRRSEMESNISCVCDSMLNGLHEYIIPSASAGRTKAKYLKLKGDLCWYLAQIKTGSEQEAVESTLKAYKSAQQYIGQYLRHLPDNSHVVERVVADTLPKGWIKERRSRKWGIQIDPYYTNPECKYEFLSKRDVDRYREGKECKMHQRSMKQIIWGY